MKRFIDIGEQTGNTHEGIKEFAFFDTIIDEFEEFGGSCTWDTRENFISDYEEKNNGEPIERYLGKIPSDWQTKEEVEIKRNLNR